MRKFIKYLFLFASPFLIIIAGYIILDPFKVIFPHDNFQSKVFVLNRDYASTRILMANIKKEQYNAFIFGSSRSQAFKCPAWSKYLPADARPFHYDANSEGIYGVWKKVLFLKRNNIPMKQVLLVTDRNFFRITENDQGHLFIKDPMISGESWWKFQLTFLKTLTDPKFLLTTVDYTIFGVQRGYMAQYLNLRKDSIVDGSNDVYYGLDNDIQKDSVAYYAENAPHFYNRKPTEPAPGISASALEQDHQYLSDILQIFKENSTNYKIVIGPLYDQKPIDKEIIEMLNGLFGKENVFDFSGVNKFTSEPGNYYEASHYKPYIANIIMDSIYTTHGQ